MFERFTMRARRSIVLAQEEARSLHHQQIGTQHLLLGLLHEGEGRAAHALRSLDFDLELARSQVLPDAEGPDPARNIPFDEGAKHALMAAYDECRLEGDEVITTGYMLLGLFCVPDGACAVLAERHIDRAAVVQALGRLGPVDEGPPGEDE